MFALSKKIFQACVLALVVLTTGAWQSNPVALAESQKVVAPEAPLYPGLTWSDPTVSVQDIRTNLSGNLLSLSGGKYEAREQFAVGALPEELLNYYSNEVLSTSGWNSFDTFDITGGVRRVFYHDAGAYLSVEFFLCPGVSSTICIAVWKSEQVGLISTPLKASTSESATTTSSTFGKKTPTNGSVDLNPASIVLSWDAYSPSPDKYSYCVKEGSACDIGDPNWTSAYTTSVTLTNLAYGKTYYWQVKAITCITCVPKTVVYANNGTAWTFKTKQAVQAVILGNVGLAGAVLIYTDGTLKTVTANGDGQYSITVPLNWSGTLTPAKTGYLFSPKSASFSNLTALQTIQNFNATQAFVISGSVRLPSIPLKYTDGTLQTVISNSDGTYSIIVPIHWSGTVTPAKTGLTFSPVSRNYSNVTTDLTDQNYRVLVSISGNASVGGAILSYFMDGATKTVTANSGGNYTLYVPFGWTGNVTPSKSGFLFTPVNRSYSNLQSKQTLQDYTATDNPIVLSSVRANVSPTSASSVGFTVTFSESVTGVDSGDFALTTTGLTGTSITQVSGSGSVYAITVNTGTGTGTLRLDVVDDDTITDSIGNPLGGTGIANGNFTIGEVYDLVNFINTSFDSTGGQDGWILESSETSNQGGKTNSIANLLYIGDSPQNNQFKSFLSFDTSGLPDGAVVTKLRLKLKVQGFVGGNMFTPTKTLGNLVMDISDPYFGTNADLVAGDFQAGASKNDIGLLGSVSGAGWRTVTLKSTAYPFINVAGTTQLSLRFQTDDNNDLNADYLKIFSGDAPAASRPQLLVEYYVP